MSGILGVFTTGTLPGRAVLERMCLGLEARGAERSALWQGEGVALAVSRHDWELEAGFSGPVLVLEEGDCVVAADTTLYYRADLLRQLRAAGVEVGGDSPSHLILAAYRAWGAGCTKWLEGEFAFILWDRRERRVLCSRDFSARRPLYYADLGDTLVVASTLSAVLAHPACPEDLNLPVLAATAGILLSAAGSETCYRAIRMLPLAGDLQWRPGGELRIGAHWAPVAATGAGDLPFESAAEELRALLTAATRERLGGEGTAAMGHGSEKPTSASRDYASSPTATRPTSIWMSGGWDSTAVFGVGQDLLRSGSHEPASLLPVSMSYPVGDPGREDEMIEEIAAFWRVPIHWVESERIPLFEQPLSGAASRDEPLAHLFEHWNRAMARGSRALGARIALDGYGGDQLFQISDIFFADLLRSGRWLELMREWRLRRERGLGRRYFWDFAVRPLLPHWPAELWGMLRGVARVQRSHLERPFPAWLEADFIRRHDLLERERAQLPSRRGGAAAEAEWYLMHPVPVHIATSLAGLALQEGVELRSPLYDRRVVEFALGRPRWERASARETKYLLRRAVRGLLPDSILAPRARRTGLAVGYAGRQMQKSYAAEFEATLREPLILAELGVISPGRLRQAVSDYLARGDSLVGMQLFFTLQTEWWLRARLRPDRMRGPVMDRGRKGSASRIMASASSRRGAERLWQPERAAAK